MAVNLKQLELTLYNSLIKAQPWDSFLKLMEEHLECECCALLLQTSPEGDPYFFLSQKVGAMGFSKMVEASKNTPFELACDGRIQTLQRLMDEEKLRHKYSTYYDYIKKLNISDLIAFHLVDQDTGYTYHFRFIRFSNSPAFGDEEIAATESLMAHLKVAVSIFSRLASQQKEMYISNETANQLGFGLIVMNGYGRVLMMNAFANAILNKKEDFFIQGGTLHVSDSEGYKKLRKNLGLLRSGEEENECTFQVPSYSNSENNWIVTLLRYAGVPYEFHEENNETYSMLLQQKTPPSVDQITRLFDLTPAEAQLTKLLTLGDSLTEAAEKLGRSRATVRVQLSAIFAKTGVHKQHQLISHILRSASRLSL